MTASVLRIAATSLAEGTGAGDVSGRTRWVTAGLAPPPARGLDPPTPAWEAPPPQFGRATMGVVGAAGSEKRVLGRARPSVVAVSR